MFGNKKKLETIKTLIEFQCELVDRAKKTLECNGLDFPHASEDNFETHQVSSFLQTPNGYEVEYFVMNGQDIIDIRNIDGSQIYHGTLNDDKNPFVIGWMAPIEFIKTGKRPFVVAPGDSSNMPIHFPRLDNYKLSHRKFFTGSEEEIKILEYLLEETKELIPYKNQDSKKY